MNNIEVLVDSIATAYDVIFEGVDIRNRWQQNMDVNGFPNDGGPLYMSTESYVKLGIPKNARNRFGKVPTPDFPVLLTPTFSSYN